MKIVFLILIYCFSFSSIAEELESFTIEELEVSCGDSPQCNEFKGKLNFLKGDYKGTAHLKRALGAFLIESSIKNLSFSLKEKDKRKLYIDFDIKEVVTEVSLVFKGGMAASLTEKNLPFKEGDYYEPVKVAEARDLLIKKMVEAGYPYPRISYRSEKLPEGVKVVFEAEAGKAKKVRNILINCPNSKLEQLIMSRLYSYINAPLDMQSLKISLGAIQTELASSGYYVTDYRLYPESSSNKDEYSVDIKIYVDALNVYFFNIEGNKILGRDEILRPIRNTFRRNKKNFDAETIKKEILQLYRGRGYLNSEVEIKLQSYNLDKEQKANTYFVKITEGEKLPIKRILFSGHYFFSDKELRDLFFSKADDLSSSGYYDEKYYQNFINILKKEYIKQGFVFVSVSMPTILLDKVKKMADIEFRIVEGIRTKVNKVEFVGLPQELEKEVYQSIRNQTDQAFNPISFEEDLKEMQKLVREKGYYYAVLKNAESSNLLSYSTDFTKVDLHFEFELGPQVRLDKAIILGNIKTREVVIRRELELHPGDLVTPSAVDSFQNTLNSLGIFSQVKVLPVKETIRDGKVDLMINVKEKRFGSIELAPGYRTDIGLKLSGGITYNNLWGMNRSLAFRGQVNQRLNYNTFDPRRRAEKRQKLEYSNNVNFNEPYFAGLPLASNTSVTSTRKRFYAFDADIIRFSNTFTKDFSQRFSTSLRYQLEAINQYDATESRDNGYFRIGAITPATTFDFRNNRINPTKGSFFNLSCEFANPTFFSQKSEDLEINFYKFVSRNRFYIPYPNGTLAISLVVGQQQNLATQAKYDKEGKQVYNPDGTPATRGNIPNIKVFRLTGVDIVRGFTDEEINRLSDGRDIGQVFVQDKAFMTNLKIEPRFFVNDSTIFGLFFDAGSVSVNSYEPLELRQSAGVSFKYLTPVGTLDFDYGYKLLRKHRADGNMEAPGRLHISIGFF